MSNGKQLAAIAQALAETQEKLTKVTTERDSARGELRHLERRARDAERKEFETNKRNHALMDEDPDRLSRIHDVMSLSVQLKSACDRLLSQVGESKE